MHKLLTRVKGIQLITCKTNNNQWACYISWFIYNMISY